MDLFENNPALVILLYNSTQRYMHNFFFSSVRNFSSGSLVFFYSKEKLSELLDKYVTKFAGDVFSQIWVITK